MRPLLLCAVVALASTCRNPDGPRRLEAPAGRTGSAPVSAAGRTGSAPVSEAVSAVRCGKCHADLHAEWSDSTHARAATGASYLAMRRGSAGVDCERCHAPAPALANEGVTCDACHRISDARPERAGGHIVLAADGDRRRGPLCDPHATDFHGSECSPLHERSELCGACHLWTLSRNGVELPIVTEFDEWKRSSYAESVTCQGCHMTTERREAATGAGVRDEVPTHRWLGGLDDLRGRALDVAAAVHSAGTTSQVTVALLNEGAGHAVPSGLSGRQIVLRVIATDRGGAELDRQERVYGRVLVDAAGAEVPFYLAERVGSDNRIATDERRRESFELTSAAGGRVTVQVLWRALSPRIAAALGVPEPQTIVLQERVIDVR